MTYTEDQIKQFADWFAEDQAVTLSSFPSTFGVVTGQDEIARGWRLEVSDEVDVSVSLLRKTASASNLPPDFLPGSLSNSYSLLNPMVDGETHEGTYRSAAVRVFRETEDGSEYFYIIQLLRKGWVTTLDDGQGGVDYSEFREDSAAYYHAGRTMHILELNGVSAFAVKDICDQLNTYDSFDDLVYFNDTLTGTWHNRLVRSEQDDDGSYVIQLYLADFYNEEMIFPYYVNERQLYALYLKLNMAPDMVETFKSTTYFDDAGNCYVSSDGVYYTKKNGQEIVAFTVSGADHPDGDGEYLLTAGDGTADGASGTVYQNTHGWTFKAGYLYAPGGFRYYDDGGALIGHVSVTTSGDVTRRPWDFDWSSSTGLTNATIENELALPATAKRLSENPAGRTIIDFSASSDDESGEVAVRVLLSWFIDMAEKVTITKGRYSEVAVYAHMDDVTEEARDNFVNSVRTDDSGNVYSSSTGSTSLYDRLNGATTTETSYPAGAAGINTQVEGRKHAIRTRLDRLLQLYTVQLEAVYTSSDTRCSYVGTDSRLTYKPNSNSAITIDVAYGLTFGELSAAMTYYNTDPGDGTRREISTPRADPETGLYSYEAIEISMTGLSTKLQLGKQAVYFGHRFPRKPTTDVSLGSWVLDADGNVVNDDYILLGGSLTLTPGTPYQPEVPSTPKVTAFMAFDDANDPVTFPESVATVNDRPSFVFEEAELACKDWGDGNLRWGFRNNYEIDELIGGILVDDSPVTYESLKPRAVFLHDTIITPGDMVTHMTPPTTGWNTGWYDGPAGFDASESTPFSTYPVLGWDQVESAPPVVEMTAYIAEEAAVPDSYGEPAITEVSSTKDISNSVRYEEAGTWSWQVSEEDAPADEAGKADPSSTGAGWIFESGDEQDFTRFVGWYSMQQIAAGMLSLKSYFADIPSNTFGTHATLQNRRKVIPYIRREKVTDGDKVSYEVWERWLTPDINDNDAWYYMGATEGLIRDKEELASEVVDRTGQSYPVTGNNSVFYEIFSRANTGIETAVNGDKNILLAEIQEDIASGPNIADTTPILARLQLASKRRRTVFRKRKFFLRRPTTADLTNSAYDGTYSIKEKWDLVKDEQTDDTAPGSAEVVTFDIVKVGEQWAVECMEVKIDDQVYRDEEAFDHFIDSAGVSMVAISVLPMHDDETVASINRVVVDKTESET